MIIEVSLNIDTSHYSVVINDTIMTTTESAEEAKLYGKALKELRDNGMEEDLLSVRNFLDLINEEFSAYEFGRWIIGLFYKKRFGAKIDVGVAPFEGEEYIVVTIYIPKGKELFASELYHPIRLESMLKESEESES